MYITYTFESAALSCETTLTLLLPGPHSMRSEAYSWKRLYDHTLKVPVVVALGDTGTESNWWMRCSYVESDIHQDPCLFVGVRGLEEHESAVRFLAEELPRILRGQFPVCGEELYLITRGKTAAFLASEPIRAVYGKVAEASGEDSAASMQETLHALLRKEGAKE